MKACIKAYCLIIGFFLFSFSSVFAQDQNVADSLLMVYQKGDLQGVERMSMLQKLAFNELNDPENAASH